MKSIASQCRDIRQKRGLSQLQLAKLMHTGQSRVAQIESEDYGRLSLSSLQALAHALGVELVVELREPNALLQLKNLVAEVRNELSAKQCPHNGPGKPLTMLRKN